eukprot:3556357-Pyramimonas_sp.AAC.1
MPPLKLPGGKFQQLLQSAKEEDSLGEKWTASARAKVKASENSRAKKRVRLHEYEQSHRIGERAWKTEPSGVEAGDRGCPGNIFED